MFPEMPGFAEMQVGNDNGILLLPINTAVAC
jgi:hypothetical protein